MSPCHLVLMANRRAGPVAGSGHRDHVGWELLSGEWFLAERVGPLVWIENSATVMDLGFYAAGSRS